MLEKRYLDLSQDTVSFCGSFVTFLFWKSKYSFRGQYNAAKYVVCYNLWYVIRGFI